MRRGAICCILLLLAPIGVRAQAHPMPTAADRAAFQAGVDAQGAIDIFQAPTICAIVLLRPRCARAIAEYFADQTQASDEMKYRYPLLRYAASGDVAVFPAKASSINLYSIDDDSPLLRTNPQAAWLKVAGSEFVFSRNVAAFDFHGNDRVTATNLVNGVQLRALIFRIGAAGAYASLIPNDAVQAVRTAKSDQMGLDEDQITALRASFNEALGSVFAVAAEPDVVVADGALGDAQIGAYAATFNELSDTPLALLEPSGRAFAAALVQIEHQRGADLKGTSASDLARGWLSASDVPSLQSAHDATAQFANQYHGRLSGDRGDAFIIGLFAAQGAYNAASLRDDDMEATVRKIFADAGPLDSLIPGFTTARLAFLATKPKDWAAENATLSAMTRLIVKQ